MNRFLALLFFMPVAGFADPFECVDPDFIEAFLGNWYGGTPVYSTSVPRDFVTIDLPAQFELVGSRVSEKNTSVVFKADASAATALENAVSAMKHDGWTSMGKNRHGSMRGFQSQSVRQAATLCRGKSEGFLSVSAREAASQSFLSFSIHKQNDRAICDERMNESRIDHGMAMESYLPNLQMPENATSNHMGSGGGGDEYNTSVVVTTTMSRAALLEFFGDQIRQQDWTFDATWSGSVASGSVWYTTSSDDEPIVGTLNISSATTDVYSVQFAATLADRNHRGVRARIVGISSSSN